MATNLRVSSIMHLQNCLARVMSAFVFYIALTTQGLCEEVEGQYEGAYEATVELVVDGARIERITVPADTRPHGDLSGILYLNIKGNAGRSWRIEFDSTFSSKSGNTWIVTIKDLQNTRTDLTKGTLRTEPPVIFSVVGRISADGTLEIYKSLSERLTLTVKSTAEQAGAGQPAPESNSGRVGKRRSHLPPKKR